jgi:Mn-dependent DtxR family transcriptional regulator
MPTRTQSLTPLARRTLIAMFELTGAGRPVHAGSLAQALGTQASAVGEALCELDARGLVWLSRCALTMPGLALAARWQRAESMRRHAA